MTARTPLAENAIADGEFWQVVGGADKGGIVVRQGIELTSDMLQRLVTGSIVKQVAIEGDRLQYHLINGDGPQTGWVTVKLSDGNPLLVRKTILSSRPGRIWPPEGSDAEVPQESLREWSPIVGRRLRILALHGGVSNSNILKFQTTPLRKLFGKDAEWLFPDGLVPYKAQIRPPKSFEDVWYEGPTEIDTRIASGKPFSSWVDMTEFEDIHATVGYITESIDKSVAWLEDYIAKQDPIDVILAYSQGAVPLNRYVELLRSRGANVPWRLGILFGPGPAPRFWHHDETYAFTSSVPTVLVYTSGSGDSYAGYHVKTMYENKYTNLIAFEHEDGHGFPRTEPRAGEIYAGIASAIRERCFGGVAGS